MHYFIHSKIITIFTARIVFFFISDEDTHIKYAKTGNAPEFKVTFRISLWIVSSVENYSPIPLDIQDIHVGINDPIINRSLTVLLFAR